MIMTMNILVDLALNATVIMRRKELETRRKHSLHPAAQVRDDGR